jgi:ABC-type multidrug transport system permease subunit
MTLNVNSITFSGIKYFHSYIKRNTFQLMLLITLAPISTMKLVNIDENT